MSLEERFLKAIDEEGDPLEVAAISHSETRHQRLQRKSKAVIDRFLGSGQRINAVGILPRYYGELLTSP